MMKIKPTQDCRVVRFRRFTHRPYAVFSSLKVRISIGVLTVEMLSVASVQTVSAQVENKHRNEGYDLKEIVVSASRVPLTLREATRPVVVLGREEIAALPAESVNDLLKYVAGVDVRQRGGLGVQTDLSIRGGTFDQIALLLNGINICDPQTGHNAVELPVELSEIERIEVLLGPAARVYGTSSLLGAVNIVTRIASRNSADVHVEGGSWGYLKSGARVNCNLRNLKNQLSGGYVRSDGYSRNRSGRLNADFRRGSLFYQGRFSDKDFTANWHFGFSDKNYGANTFYGTGSDDQYEHLRKYQLAVQAESRGRYFHFRPAVYWNRSEDRFEYFRGHPERSPFNYHRTDVIGLHLNSWVNSCLGTTAFGAELRNEGVVSTTLGEPLSRPRPVPGTAGAVYRNGLNRTHLSFHLEHHVDFRGWGMSAGVVAVKNTGNEMNFRFYPGIDLSYAFSPACKVFASYNTSLRMPTFTELYYSVDGHRADPHLKPEEMSAFNIGARYHTPAVQASANVFYHRGSRLIDWIKDFSEGPDAVWRSVNHATLHTLGAEISGNLDFERWLRRPVFWRSLQVSYAWLHQDKERQEHLQSKYALEYLRHQVVARAGFRLWKSLGLDMAFRWNDRVGSYQAGTALKSYAPYALLDARLAWTSSRYRIYLEANNLLDRRYYDHGNLPQPGCWIGAGLQVSLSR